MIRLVWVPGLSGIGSHRSFKEAFTLHEFIKNSSKFVAASAPAADAGAAAEKKEEVKKEESESVEYDDMGFGLFD